MRYRAKIRLFVSLTMIFSIFSILLVGDVWALKTTVSVRIENEYIAFEDCDPIVRNGRVLVPIGDIFSALDIHYAWSEKNKTITAKENGNTYVLTVGSKDMKINDEDFVLDTEPIFINSSILVPIRGLSLAIGRDVTWDSRVMTVSIGEKNKRNPVDNTAINDKYRYKNYNGSFNDFHVFNNGSEYFCMEIVDIDDEKCEVYSEIINDFAKAAPSANTYSIVIPTASEFYASENQKSDYLSAIKKINDGFSDNVIPINIVKPLMEHADENIFFKTDHHWTPLGAYYAYKEFLTYKDEDIQPPSSFRVERNEMFQGSFLQYLEGSDGYELLKDTYDTFNLYYPKDGFIGSSYHDVDLTEYIDEMKGINTNIAGYDCLLEGDYPVEVFKTMVDNGKKICIVKESFGNAFAIWALNNYEEVYVVDYRRFNDYAGDQESFRPFFISDFYKNVLFDDLVIISYPVSVYSQAEVTALSKMAK